MIEGDNQDLEGISGIWICANTTREMFPDLTQVATYKREFEIDINIEHELEIPLNRLNVVGDNGTRVNALARVI